MTNKSAKTIFLLVFGLLVAIAVFYAMAGCGAPTPSVLTTRTYATLTAPPATIPSITPQAADASASLDTAQGTAANLSSTIDQTTPDTFASVKPGLQGIAKALMGEISQAGALVRQIAALSAKYDAAIPQYQKAVSDRDVQMGEMNSELNAALRAVALANDAEAARLKHLKTLLEICGVLLASVGIAGYGASWIPALAFLAIARPWLEAAAILGMVIATVIHFIAPIELVVVWALGAAAVVVIVLLIYHVWRSAHDAKVAKAQAAQSQAHAVGVIQSVEAAKAAGTIDMAKAGPVMNAVQTAVPGLKVLVDTHTPVVA